MKNAQVYAVILANSGSEHLWPLSRKKRPKQLLPFIKNSSLLEQAVDRATQLVPIENIWLFTDQVCADELNESIVNSVKQVVVEPEFRGTAAAILTATMLVQEHDPEAIIIFIPADHYIAQAKLCAEFMEHAVDYAKSNKTIVLLASKPAYSSVTHSYISYKPDAQFPARVTSFTTGLTQEQAEHASTTESLWNTGIFAAQATVLLDICQKKLPELFACVAQYVHSYGEYDQIPVFSIDTLFNKSEINTVLPVDFAWSDISTLESFFALGGIGESGEQNIIEIDSSNNLIEAQDTLVALVGVTNICVIQKDDILLVINRDQIEKVKLVVDILKKNHSDQYL